MKNGDVQAAEYVLDQLNIKTSTNWNDKTANVPVWGQASHDNQQVSLVQMPQKDYTMPNVHGMGARDAVFLLEKSGLKVRLHGAGSVKSQSIPAGTALHEGMRCELTLN